MLMSRRAWCVERRSPRSREAFGSNPWPPTKSNPRILSHGSKHCSRMRASGTRLLLQCSRSVLSKWVSGEQGASQVPRWDSDQSQHGDLIGSCNTRWRRELPGGDTEEPEADNFRVSANEKRNVKSSTMRGAQALASEPQQRRCRTGKARSGW